MYPTTLYTKELEDEGSTYSLLNGNVAHAGTNMRDLVQAYSSDLKSQDSEWTFLARHLRKVGPLKGEDVQQWALFFPILFYTIQSVRYVQYEQISHDPEWKAKANNKDEPVFRGQCGSAEQRDHDGPLDMYFVRDLERAADSHAKLEFNGGFMSTSLQRSTAANFANSNCACPKDKNGVDALDASVQVIFTIDRSGLSQHAVAAAYLDGTISGFNEREVLLLPHTRFKVNSVVAQDLGIEEKCWGYAVSLTLTHQGSTLDSEISAQLAGGIKDLFVKARDKARESLLPRSPAQILPSVLGSEFVAPLELCNDPEGPHRTPISKCSNVPQSQACNERYKVQNGVGDVILGIVCRKRKGCEKFGGCVKKAHCIKDTKHQCDRRLPGEIDDGLARKRELALAGQNEEENDFDEEGE